MLVHELVHTEFQKTVDKGYLCGLTAKEIEREAFLLQLLVKSKPKKLGF